MSDSDDNSSAMDGVVSGTERPWYGSLDSQIKANDDSPHESKSNSPAHLSIENIHTSSDYMKLEEPDLSTDKAALLQEFERKRRARMITVPTDDCEVRDVLRQHGEPICLFGEGPADRRNRLKDFLSRQDDSSKGQNQELLEKESANEQISQPSSTIRKEETWYHKGPPSLREARMFIVNYSVPKARGRLKNEILEKEIPDSTRKAKKQEMQNKLRSFNLFGSQNADTRPISYCSFSPSGKMLATSSWSGLSKIWRTVDCKELLTLKSSTSSSYVDCVEWHPGSGLSIDASTVNLVSSFRDGRILLWSLDKSEPLDYIPKMESRVSRVKFHPSGRFIGACVHDNSWRLWDLQAREEVLFQEGHSKEVYCIGFQNDGALAATGGLDCFGRIWDLRTGRCSMFLSGHIGPILSLDWSPDGYHLATGSDDNTAKIWDVRARRCSYTIPAHSSLISGVSYDPEGGNYLATCSYDGSVKLWCHGSFQLLKALEGHGQKVLGIDISPNGNLIATSSFDRTFKLWGPD